MGKVQFVLDRGGGIVDLLQSAEMQAVIDQKAAAVQAACGEGFEMDGSIKGDRYKATVRAATPKAYYSNRKHKTLQKALGSAR